VKHDHPDLAQTDWVKWFAQSVLHQKQLTGWKIKFLDFNDGSRCNNEFKHIEISGLSDQPWYYLKEIILHEVAHALAPDQNYKKASATSHDASFFERYGELLIEFSQYEPTIDYSDI